MSNFCSVCSKNVRKNAKAVLCDICDHLIHINCNYINNQKYERLKLSDDESFYCSTCLNSLIPFGNESNKVFSQTQILGFNSESNLENFAFSIDKTDQRLINHISNLIFENSEPETECTNFCKYYSIDDFLKRKFNNDKHFSMFHLNINSLQRHKPDLDILLDELKFDFFFTIIFYVKKIC